MSFIFFGGICIEMMYEQVGRFQRGFLWKKISSVEREEI